MFRLRNTSGITKYTDQFVIAVTELSVQSSESVSHRLVYVNLCALN